MHATTPKRLKFSAPNVRALLTRPYKNFYWSDHIAAMYCGLGKPPQHSLGVWQHGWIPQWEGLTLADQVFGVTLSGFQSEQYWVATKYLEDFVRSKGFSKVCAIGLPLVYTMETPVERRTGSLLVMPLHSLLGQKLGLDVLKYVQTIVALRPYFREIVICVTVNCWANGYWVPEFQAAGFKVMLGAGGDPSTLDKMANLFREYEFVTANGFGSQLAYASCFGAKVSI